MRSLLLVICCWCCCCGWNWCDCCWLATKPPPLMDDMSSSWSYLDVVAADVPLMNTIASARNKSGRVDLLWLILVIMLVVVDLTRFMVMIMVLIQIVRLVVCGEWVSKMFCWFAVGCCWWCLIRLNNFQIFFLYSFLIFGSSRFGCCFNVMWIWWLWAFIYKI